MKREKRKFCKRGHSRLSENLSKDGRKCKLCRRINYKLNTSIFCSNGHLRNNENYSSGHCKDCYRELVNNPERKEKFNLIQRKSYIKREFGITIEQYNSMFEQQNGCCAICKKHQNNFKKKLSVDHNHNTGRIRGLLCNICNLKVLPIIENMYNLIELAKQYLEDKDNVIRI